MLRSLTLVLLAVLVVSLDGAAPNATGNNTQPVCASTCGSCCDMLYRAHSTSSMHTCTGTLDCTGQGLPSINFTW